MLQIIIWMGCVYLIFKGWEMKQFDDVNYPKQDEGKFTRGELTFIVSIIVSIVFFILSLVQASDIPRF